MWREWLGDLSGWRPRCLASEAKLDKLVWLTTPPSVETVARDLTWVADIMEPLLISNRGVTWSPMDNIYWLTEDIGRVLTWANALPRPEVFECEDRAMEVMSRAARCGVNVGIVNDFDTAHAYNLVLMPKGELWIYSPRDELRWPLGSWQQKDFKLEWADVWF